MANEEDKTVQNNEPDTQDMFDENDNMLITDEAIAVMAGVAATEVKGVASMSGGFAGGIAEVFGRNGRKLMIGFVRRFGKDAVVAKELIDKDDLGEIYYAKASYLRRHGCPGGWFCDKKRSGGGPLIDIGIHVIDLARYLMGNPKPVSVSASTFSKLGARSQLKASISYTSVGRQEEEYNDVEDLAVGMIKFENGATLFAETSYSLNIKGDYNAVELCGTKGGISINPSVHFYTNLHNYMSDIDFVGTTQFDDDGIVDELRYFIDALLGKVEFGTTAEDGVVMMQILDAMYESAKTGKEVVIGEQA